MVIMLSERRKQSTVVELWATMVLASRVADLYSLLL